MPGPPRLLSDERLATLAGTGSDPAFAMLYRRYDGPLHGYCLSIVKNAEDARDVLQSAWMKALVALRAGSRRPGPTGAACATGASARISPTAPRAASSRPRLATAGGRRPPRCCHGLP